MSTRSISVATSAMHRVGELEELVDAILSFASRSSLYNCTLVCKAYYDIAVKTLWRRIPSAWPLLHLLGYIKCIDGNPGVWPKTWEFTSPPDQSNWEAFDRLAKHVRVMARDAPSFSRGTMDYHDPTEGPEGAVNNDPSHVCDQRFAIHPKALEQILERQKGLKSSSTMHNALLPNLERLDFTFSRFQAPSNTFVTLLGPKLKSLHLSYHVCRQMQIDQESVEGQIRLIREGFQTLSELADELPLERLEVSIDLLQPLAGDLQEINDEFVTVLHRYTTLRHLKTPPFASHEDLVSALATFSNLRSLSTMFGTAQAMLAFVTDFAPLHPNILDLELEHRNVGETPPSIVVPLFQCRKLTRLSITAYTWDGEFPPPGVWPLPDIYQMSEAWPHLEYLDLVPFSAVPLADLAVFQSSALFPKLKQLRLSVNSIGAPPPSLSLQLALRPLQSLQTLFLITDVDTTEDDVPALIKFAARIGNLQTKIILDEEDDGYCTCEVCCRALECHEEELRLMKLIGD